MQEIMEKCGFGVDEVFFIVMEFALKKGDYPAEFKSIAIQFFRAGSIEEQYKVIEKMIEKLRLSQMDVLYLMKSVIKPTRKNEQKAFHAELLSGFKTQFSLHKKEA